MNENLSERFGRSRKAFRPAREEANVWILPQKLNPKVSEYFEAAKKPVDGGPWLDRPEIPTSGEVLDRDTDGGSSSSVVEIVPNRPEGAWESKDAYLGAQYELLREDAVRPLREAVDKIRITPTAEEDTFNGAVGIYSKVHICAITCSTRGIATRVTFSLARTGKKILWEQSKRLITGSLVVLTPASDMFKTKAVVAIVAARPLAALQQNPPEIDLFIARAEEQELDPAQEWVMIEDRGGLYEADRHTLLALQRMMREPFPLSEHLVAAQRKIIEPDYVLKAPTADLTAVLTNNKHETYENVDILKDWPSQPHSDLDASQLAALRRVLTKRLAIVQGPPGTGKTYISVQAIKVVLTNRKPDDPPIIIACQTNHAVDQILRQIAVFEPDFVRLGDRSKDRDVIMARTLHEVRNQTSENNLAGSWLRRAKKTMREMEKEFILLLTPLKPEKTPLNFHLLQEFCLLTRKQADSLEAGASQWVQDQLSNPNEARSPFAVWLGRSLVSVPPKQQPEEFGFEFEEADLEFEQLKELEAENVAKDDEDLETLSGKTLPIADNFTCRKVVGMTDAKVKEALKEQDMWKVSEAVRPAIYRYLQAEAKKTLLKIFRKKAKVFNEQAGKRRIGAWERDETILKKQKIIGMTTTGFSKYRGLIAALEPKIVLVEEAAEILEAPVTVTCLPSLQHLILVGDHQQLRPHCHVRAHEDKPYYLNVSLFERMVRNRVEFDTLSKQRRMIPEVRRLLYPIYGDLIKDHTSVLDPAKRPNVPGMGGVNSLFFTHQWPEQRDEHMSAFNPDEADMIVGFVEYLVYNGMDTEDITVLTFYNGQRKILLAELRKKITLGGRRFNVVTVDSYQGEENKVVLLSLVRSNDKGQIGFLSIVNRVCVALSRAQCGFYIFGNGMLLYDLKPPHPTWQKVIDIMANRRKMKDRLKVEPTCRVSDKFLVKCSNHDNRTDIKDAGDWEKIVGGCAAVRCDGHLPCGHPCELFCHPFSHDSINCQQACGKSLACGHECQQVCGETCTCKTCTKGRSPARITNIQAEAVDGKELSQKSSSGSWKSFADGEPMRYAKEASKPPSLRTRLEKEEMAAAAVLDLSSEDQMTREMKQLNFGVDGTSSAPLTMVGEEKVSGDGTRKKWKETVEPGVETTGHKRDWSKESSLLD